MGRDRAPLRAVEPAVGSPAQAVGDGVSVLKAEAGEMHDGIAVGDVVVVRFGVEQEVGRVQHPHAAAAALDRGGDVQAVHKGGLPVEHTIVAGALVDGDFVPPPDMMGRWQRYLVVDGAPIIVVADDLESGGFGVLEVLHDPHAAAFVEIKKQRLCHGGFGQQRFQLQLGRNAESLQGLGRAQRLGIGRRHAADAGGSTAGSRFTLPGIRRGVGRLREGLGDGEEQQERKLPSGALDVTIRPDAAGARGGVVHAWNLPGAQKLCKKAIQLRPRQPLRFFSEPRFSSGQGRFG